MDCWLSCDVVACCVCVTCGWSYDIVVCCCLLLFGLGVGVGCVCWCVVLLLVVVGLRCLLFFDVVVVCFWNCLFCVVRWLLFVAVRYVCSCCFLFAVGCLCCLLLLSVLSVLSCVVVAYSLLGVVCCCCLVCVLPRFVGRVRWLVFDCGCYVA